MIYILEKFPGAGPFALSEPKNLIAIFQRDSSIHVYRLNNGKRAASLEGSASKFGRLTFTEDGAYLIAKSLDGSCFIWTTANWKLVSLTHETVIYPRFPLYASPINPLRFLSTGSMQKSIVIRELSEPDLPDLSGLANPQYKNCKIVIMGEQGVGKSALANQLLGRGWRLTESTHGRQVTRLMREREGTEYRELYLWDLAGQPNYHLIHQLHLDETYVALVMFDDQAERDPFARPRYWDRALSTAVVNSTFDAEGITKFLVAGRVDRGAPHVSPEAIQRFVGEHGFKQYFRTSARTGLGVPSLKDAILNSIKWDELPSVSSTALFQEVQQLILDLQTERVHVLPTQEAYERLLRLVPQHRPTIGEFCGGSGFLDSRIG